MARALRQFDYSTISDAILHVRYTAREDAGPFKIKSVNHLDAYFKQTDGLGLLRMFDLKREFSTQWHRFLYPENASAGNVFEMEMSADLFSVRDQGKTLVINAIWVLVRCAFELPCDVVISPPLVSGSDTVTLVRTETYGNLHLGQVSQAALPVDADLTDAPVQWKLKMTRPGGGNLQEDSATNKMEVDDVMLVLGYGWL